MRLFSISFVLALGALLLLGNHTGAQPPEHSQPATVVVQETPSSPPTMAVDTPNESTEPASLSSGGNPSPTDTAAPQTDESAQLVTETLNSELGEIFATATFSSLLLALGATLLLAGLMRLVFLAFQRYETALGQWAYNRLPTLKVQQVVLLGATQSAALIKLLFRGVQWVVHLTLLYWYAFVVFGLFPATQSITQALVKHSLSLLTFAFHGIINFLPNALTIGLIGVATYYAIQALQFVALQMARGRLVFASFHKDWAIPTFKILRFLIIIFAIIMVFPHLPGFDSPAFQGISVFVGVLLSLGSSSAVANVVAGVVLMYMRPFKVGDFVKVGDVTGTVEEMTLLVLRLTTPKAESVTMPNSSALGGTMTNYSRAAKNNNLVLYTTVTIGYDVPWEQVHQLLMDAALNTESIVQNPAPFVLQTKLDDFYVHYELNATTSLNRPMPRIYSDLHQHIQQAFAQAGVEIMSPHYRALRDGGAMTLPQAHLPQGYSSPPIRVQSV